MGKRTSATSEADERPRNPYAKLQGEMIDDARKAQGLRQVELAEKLGITQAQLSRILSGERRTKPERIARIAEVLGISVDEITPKGVPLDEHSGSRPRKESVSMPPGLAGFLERYAEKEKIDKRELWYLRESRFRAEPWVDLNDEFWLHMLHWWRTFLAKQQRAVTPPKKIQ